VFNDALPHHERRVASARDGRPQPTPSRPAAADGEGCVCVC
jgi:hypothetical protein